MRCGRFTNRVGRGSGRGMERTQDGHATWTLAMSRGRTWTVRDNPGPTQGASSLAQLLSEVMQVTNHVCSFCAYAVNEYYFAAAYASCQDFEPRRPNASAVVAARIRRARRSISRSQRPQGREQNCWSEWPAARAGTVSGTLWPLIVVMLTGPSLRARARAQD